jgi:DNA-binding GntR family transcriptional regulator
MEIMRSDAMSDDRPIRERARAHIQQKIINGELPAGSAISELALSKELGSSRTPIREAVGQLVAEGLVELIPNRGAVVAQFGRSDVLELFELREALEVYGVRKVASSGLRETEVARLREVVAEPLQLKDELVRCGAACLDAGQMRRFMASDLAFHTLLLHAAGNRRILKVVNETRLLIRIFEFPHARHSVEQLVRIHSQHTGILEAIVKRDPAQAAESIATHIAGSREERLNAFDTQERDSSLRAGGADPLARAGLPGPAVRSQ